MRDGALRALFRAALEDKSIEPLRGRPQISTDVNLPRPQATDSTTTVSVPKHLLLFFSGSISDLDPS